MVGSSFDSASRFGTAFIEDGRRGAVLGPVRIELGRICSKPWELATFSMDLKY